MKRLLILFMMLCVALPVMAQSGRLTAKIVDMETKDGVIGAIVELQSKSNPNLRKHNTTGAGGSVTIIGLAPGDYTMSVAFIGYSPYSADVKIEGNTNIGTVELAPGVQIEAVVKEVQALRTSQNGDTVAYNAAAFKVASDADVEGLLKKMPGITVTNGQVEAQGEQVKKIFVDGKEFFGEDVSTALNSLPAQAVDRVEVFNKLSDNAEFSGMDDGEGYKAINIVTHANMRQGVFGKLYGGYGYQPDIDGSPAELSFQNTDIYEPQLGDVTSHHKYNLGGNVNIFHDNHRLSVIGLLNNVNQQNFSFEDILGVSGGGGGGGMGGGPGRGVGQYMVRPQSGVANVGSIGVQYTGAWGEKDAVKLNGSYFFNGTNTRNKSLLQKWYESPSPDDYLEQEGESESHNLNHRLNLRLDWRINKNMSLMSRTNFSFQGNNPYSQQYGELVGETPGADNYEILYNGSEASSQALRFSQFLQYRVNLGKVGRTITVDGRYALRNTIMSNTNSFSTLATDYLTETPILRYVSSFAPQGETDVRANVTYTEPIGKNSQLSLQYRFDYEDQQIEKTAYITGADYDIAGLVPDASLSSLTNSISMEHRVGPGYRYAKGKNTVVANVYYQHSILDGVVKGENITRDYDHVTYFLMTNFAFNPQNTIRLFLSSYTQNPDVRNLQDIYDVSNAQYLSKGNPNLRSSYNHRMNFHYVRSNIEKGRTFMWMFSAQLTQDYIGQSISYNPGDIDIDGNIYNPLQYSTYENMDGYYNLRTHISYGFPVSPIKCNLNLSAGVNYSNTPSMIDGLMNYTSNMGYDARLSLGSNISENIDFTIEWSGTFNDARQSLVKGNARNARNQYFSHTASGQLKWVFWKGFTLTGAVNYNQYIGFTNDYNEDFLICNVYLGKKLFKNQQGEILVGVNDLLNQNKAFARTVGSGYTQNAWNSVIGRYFTVQFNYNLRYFGKKGSKNIDDYDGMGQRGGMPGGMPFPGGRPPMPPMHR